MGADSQIRRLPRVNLKAFAAVSGEGKAADIYKEQNAACINISEGGCCLSIDASLSGADIDFGVKVGIDLPDGLPRFIAAGSIVWLKELSDEKMAKYLVGVQFENLKPQDKERIMKFIQTNAG